MKRFTMGIVVMFILVSAAGAFAKGRLVIYCSNEPFACQAVADAFAKKYDVNVQMTRSGSGSTYAKILAEKDNPKGDVWYAGTLDPHSQAGVNGLLEPYASPMLKEIGPEFRNPATSKQHHSAGVYAGVLGYSVNTDVLKEKNLPMPRSWEDLTKPEYKGLIQVASPQSSGTAYTVLATMVQLKGEEEAFVYLAKLHQNVNQYTKSGSAPGKAAARGETMIGIGFLHDHALQKANGFPLELVVPSEGTGYEIGGLSIIKGARNMENAKKFVDFMLSAEGQEVPQRVKMFQVPTNVNANVPKEAIRLDQVKLIDYDFVKYGSEEMRSHLIDRWGQGNQTGSTLTDKARPAIMNMRTNHTPGEIGPWVVLSWIVLAFTAYCFLPWTALEYGITDFTSEEWVDALGWKHSRHTLLFPILLLLLAPFAWIRLPGKGFGWVFALAAATTVGLVLLGFIATKTSMGLGAAVGLLCLAALFAIGISELGFQRGDTFIAGAVIFVVFMVCVFIFFPVWEIFRNVLFDREKAFVPLQFFQIITSFGVGRVIGNTLLLAFSVGLATTVFGLIFALYAIRATTRLRYLIRIFYILPIITPPFVVGMSLILIFGRAGMINDGLMYLIGPAGLLTPEGSPGFFERSGYIYGFVGIFLAQTLSLTPVSYMVISGMLSSINPAMEEASLTMRANRWGTLWNVTLPLLRPSIANAFLLGMISSAADFGNPLVLGGEYDVLSTEIYFSIAGAQLDFAKAAALGLILLFLSLSIFYIQKKWIGKKSYVTVTGVETAGNVTPLPPGLQRGMTIFIVFWFILVGFLYMSIFLGGFVKQWGADYTLTLSHHIELWSKGFGSGAWPSFLNSLSYSILAAPLTTLVGVLIAYILTRKQFLGRGIIDFGTVLIFAIPGTVIGVAYILAFNTAPIELTGTAAILIITMAIRAMPVGIRGGMSALSQISTNLEEASLLQRAGSLRTIRSVLLPLLKSTIVSSMAYSFIRAMTTVSAVIFLATAGTDVATTYILSRVESGDTGVAVAYGSVLIFTMLVFTLLVQVMTGRSRTEKQVKTL